MTGREKRVEKEAKAMIDERLSPEVAAFSESLSGEIGIPRSDVLLKALALYKLAAEAEARGDRIAVLSPDDDIVTEVNGIREAFNFAGQAMW